MQPTFVTSNPNKVKEVEAILGRSLERKDLDLPEIQAIDVNQVVRDKVKRAYQQLKRPVIVEDTGLYLKDMNGFPGALTKWVLKTIGADGICQFPSNSRKAYAKTAVGLYAGEGSTEEVFTGQVEGKIATTPQGETSFGWDAIFIPQGYNQTFAQLGKNVKNELSMRRQAFSRLRNYLKNLS